MTSVARSIVAISRALELYEAGKPADALAALDNLGEPDPLPDRPEWLAAQMEHRSDAAQAGALSPAAALDWVALARDRLRLEQGEDVDGANVPVPLALRSALNCLGA
ncbi:MAG: hypothetical protein K9M02_16930 [Thiohalocapsa sp.]|nr:hypothetical protein [Thiohalocapsa sp.]